MESALVKSIHDDRIPSPIKLATIIVSQTGDEYGHLFYILLLACTHLFYNRMRVEWKIEIEPIEAEERRQIQ
ncbi:hypothetical protein DOE73_22465 [Paenibacillus dendritiformis]|nr:hypothetical protein DOE73_22465 [Paenibacillus dendritiformis]